MNILLTGIDGYIGWPTALKLSKEFPEARIIGVDSLGRRKWVEESGAVSCIPIAGIYERIATAKQYGFDNISFICGDLTNRDFVSQLFDVYKFDVVLHMAAQPSAPYSHINGEKANFTQFNNNQSTRNILWSIKEKNLLDRCYFIETTTTGVYGAPEFEIPEGFVMAENNGKKDLIPFHGMAGSFYHMSKCNDVNNMWLANKLWKLSILDLRTSILYGTETEETVQDSRLATRFDFDFYFGVVVNRFCAMVLAGYPLTIYGKGEQRKPQISLEDCVQSCVNSVKLNKTSEFRVYNQTTEVISIVDIAQLIKQAADQLGIKAEIKHIPNPRIEKEEHPMMVDTTNFRKLLPNPKYDLAAGVYQILKSLLPYKSVIEQYKDRFITQ
ncbi:MAG: NAD-dependent epimerase/dehydratase family protein [Nitrospirae bacterium]|nr:NAD-dependent epimerase/dehydratase family protein [Nitrospirota bacterium]